MSTIKEGLAFLMTIPLKLLGQLPQRERLINRYMMEQAHTCGKYAGDYYANYRWAKHASTVVSVERITEAHEKTAIVMQGPLVKEDNFTVETVKIYGKLYPGTLVIVSTWSDEDPQIIDQLRELENCIVVLSDFPQHSGILNLNYQITTTMAGLRKAKECGKEFAFKTRCDFRFLRIGLLNYFFSLCRAYPLGGGIPYQKYRIILGSDVAASFFRAFWVTDRYNFGYIDDMLAYWDYELDEIDWSKEYIKEVMLQNRRYTWRERIEAGLGVEPRILRNYIKRTEGCEPECSIKEYWGHVKRQFIMVSFEDTGANWAKYTFCMDRTLWTGVYYSQTDSNAKCLCYNWDFGKWLSLYNGILEYVPEYECIQQQNYVTDMDF